MTPLNFKDKGSPHPTITDMYLATVVGQLPDHLMKDVSKLGGLSTLPFLNDNFKLLTHLASNCRIFLGAPCQIG